MEYNSLILHSLTVFKSKLNSLDSPTVIQESYGQMLEELRTIESIICVHAHKTGVFSVFLPEVRDLSLKLASLKRLYPLPKKRPSLFSQQLERINKSCVDKLKSQPLEAEFMKKNEVPAVDALGSKKEDEAKSKKRQKIESLVQDRLASNSGAKFFRPGLPLAQNQTLQSTVNNLNNSFFSKDAQNKDPNSFKEGIVMHPKEPFRKEPYSTNANRNIKDYFPSTNTNTGNTLQEGNNYAPIFQRNALKNQPAAQKPQNDPSAGFVTAKDQLRINGGLRPQPPFEDNPEDPRNNPSSNLSKRFQPPYKAAANLPAGKSRPPNTSLLSRSKLPEDKFKALDPKMVELIESEILDNTPKLCWADICGLEAPKTKIIEMIVWPFSNPEIFTGIRAPPRGLLLFGPPGTGKTMIGKAVASDTNFTFFSISASSLTSKWVGEGEKMVKTLFALASAYQPAVVFIDEVDSLLCSRSENENEASRRIKTEFLCQMEGTNTNSNERLLLIGATNRPQELDDAALRRFVKKLYIPLPNKTGRRDFIKSIIRKETELGNKYQLSEAEIEEVVEKTKGYSGADLRNLCAEAALNPLRGVVDISRLTKESLRPTNLGDFIEALGQVKPTVSQKDLKQYLEWNRSFGTVQFNESDLES